MSEDDTTEAVATESETPDSSVAVDTELVSATPAAPAETDEQRTNRRKTREGLVISSKMDKTVVVAVIDRVRHPRYGKTLQRTKKLYAHDEANDAHVGDRVRVQETRPMSKLKRWRVVEVVERAR